VIAGAKIDIFCVYARVLRKKNAKKFVFLSNTLNLRGEVE
jgi:sRNA-binding regulator protein Hfq